MEMKALLYYRSKLDDHDKKVYDELVQRWMHFEKTISISALHCDFSTLIHAIHCDYPLLFYVNYYRVAYRKSVCGWHIKGDYLYEKEEAKILLSKCEEWGNYIIRNLPLHLGKTEQALWLHDVILNNVTYGEENGVRSHNMIGVVSDGQAVCEGISMAYKFLCDLADIPCIYVSGMVHQQPHGWNMIWLNNQASFVDVTNDRSAYGGYDRKNFLRSAKEMAGYVWDKNLIPDCRLSNKSDVYETALSRADVEAILQRRHDCDSIQVHLQFERLLKAEEIQNLITFCILTTPSLVQKKISYSEKRQMIFIQNAKTS